jgi:hypothetical protein
MSSEAGLQEHSIQCAEFSLDIAMMQASQWGARIPSVGVRPETVLNAANSARSKGTPLSVTFMSFVKRC